MRKLYENFHILHFQKRIVSVETICGNTVLGFGHTIYVCRGVIDGKLGKAAALHKFPNTLTLSQSKGANYAQPLALPHLIFFMIMPLFREAYKMSLLSVLNSIK
jgi:hypothetical protein